MIEEVTVSDAPEWLNADHARSWVEGYNAALAQFTPACYIEPREFPLTYRETENLYASVDTQDGCTMALYVRVE